MRTRDTTRGGSREGTGGRPHGAEHAGSPLAGLQLMADRSAPVQRLAVMQAKGAGDEERKDGSLPEGLRAGVEKLSGMNVSDVRVHYNSSRPAALQAHAYAQGSDIHVAPGQEQHLPHEAWHVVQQRQGRVRPTTSVAGTAVNDDPGLEAEADRMGARALSAQPSPEVGQREEIAGQAVQRVVAQLDGVTLSNARKTHILAGDSTGGGHRPGAGKPGKTEFPAGWDDNTIVDALFDVAKTGSVVGAGNIPDSKLMQKTVNGVTIKVVLGKTGNIITGFPTGGAGVKRN